MKLKEKNKAIKLREKGYSLKEISRILKVAKSSVSTWVRDIKLSSKARARLLTHILKGQFISAEKKKNQTREFNEQLKKDAQDEILPLAVTLIVKKILCSLIYWCEGSKNYQDGVTFVNSDPGLTKLFIDLLAEGFGVKREKIVARLHLHNYHNPKRQKLFWAKSLGLSLGQFRKPYLKPNTAKRIRANYPGCISVRYYNSILARKIMYLAQAYINKGV